MSSTSPQIGIDSILLPETMYAIDREYHYRAVNAGIKGMSIGVCDHDLRAPTKVNLELRSNGVLGAFEDEEEIKILEKR